MTTHPHDSSSLPKAPPVREIQKDPEPNKTFDEMPGAFELFRPSWEAFTLNWGTFVLAVILPILILIIPALLAIAGIYTRSSDYLDTHQAMPVIFNVLLVIVGVIGIFVVLVFYTVLLYIVKLQSAKGRSIDLKSAIKLTRPVMWTTMGTYLLRNLIIFVGLLLLIFPGLYLWRRLMLAPYYAIDQKLGVIESLKCSAADSKPFSGAIWGMIGIYVIIQLAGIVPFAGYFISIGMAIAYCCAQGIRYLQIKEATS